MHQRVKNEIGAKALQKRDHQLRGVSAVRSQNKQRDAHHQTEEHLKIDFLFCGETKVALFGNFRVIVDKTDDRETDERKQRKQDERICEIGPKERRHGGGKDNQDAAHRGSARFFLVFLRAFFADELADLQFAAAADQRRAKGQRQKHRREAGVHGSTGDVAKNI